MKSTKRLVIGAGAIVLTIAIIKTGTVSAAYSSISNFFVKHKERSENELFKVKLASSKDELITELQAIDSSIFNVEEKIVGLPVAQALLEQKDEFNEAEILDMLKKSQKYDLYETTLVKMYIEKGGQIEDLVALLDSDNLSLSAKSEIISTGDLSVDILKRFIYHKEENISKVAMKSMMVKDAKQAYDIALDFISKDYKPSDNEVYIAGLAIENYLNQKKLDDKEQAIVLEKLKKMISKRPNNKTDIARDRLVYALAEASSLETLGDMLDDNTIDESLKITAIEKNLGLIVNRIKKGLTDKEEIIVINAMHIMPITEVGEAIESYYRRAGVNASNNINKLIDYIKSKGVTGIFK